MAMVLTLLRFALIIPFVACFFVSAPWAMTAAFWIFVVASITDFLDGWVARARGEVSVLGAALDPIADKLLLAAALVMLVDRGALTGLGAAAAALMLMRELLVAGLREAVIPTGITLAVTKLAKIKTTLQLIAIAGVVGTLDGGALQWMPVVLVTILYWLAVLLTVITGVQYSWWAVQACATLKSINVPRALNSKVDHRLQSPDNSV